MPTGRASVLMTTARPTYKSYINPHIPQDGQPYEYYIGDIYERYQALADGEWDREDNSSDGCICDSNLNNRVLYANSFCNSPYLRYVKTLARSGWPRYRYLSNFIESSTVPTKDRFLVPADRCERQLRFHIVVIDYSPTVGLTRHVLKSPADFERRFSSMSWIDSRGNVRLLVVEDLSSTVIEVLGSKFDIDPALFSGHIGDYSWYNTRDPWFEIPVLHSKSTMQSSFSMRHVQPRYFRDSASVEAAKTQIGSFNVLRRIDFDVSNKTWADIKDSAVGLVRTSTSCWIRPQVRQDQGWLGILLVDPSIIYGFPLWGGYDNIRPPPGINQLSLQPSKVLFRSPLEDFVHWTMSMSSSELEVLKEDPEYIISSIYSMIPAQWLLVVEIVTTRLALIEWELEAEAWRTPSGLDETLRKLHPWRRRVTTYGSQIQLGIECLESRYVTQLTPKPHWETLLENFRTVQRRHRTLQEKVEKIVSVLTAIISIEESKKAMVNSRDITRVTYLAFIFIPLSFVASFLSMNTSFPDGNKTVYWTYFVISLPLSGLSLTLTVYWSQIRQRWYKLRKANPGDGRYYVVGPLPKT